MYLPEHFRVDDTSRLHALMRAKPFATLVSTGPSGLVASHLPTVLKTDGDEAAIECHLARANPHWKELALGAEALMIFQGADGYITPRWYPSKAEHGKVVPTWNFVTVHAYGRPEVVEDAGWLLRHVTELSTQHEAGAEKPWAVSDAPESYVNAMLRGIVGFRFQITRLEGKWKLSQNRERRDQAGVVDGLRVCGTEPDRAMAEQIAARLEPNG